MSDDLTKMLNFDPLSAAEDITGVDYKDDEGTLLLGMSMAMLHNRAKEIALCEANDTHFRQTFDEAVAIFADMGFAEVLRDTFAGQDDREDTYLVLWHPEGLLATCESYGEHLNTAKVLYNYAHANGALRWDLTSSGRFREDGVWVGDHDAREGIRHNLNALRAEGEFLSTWVERPFLWLLTYMDTKVEGYDYDAINEERVARLPEHVRQAITPADEVEIAA